MSYGFRVERLGVNLICAGACLLLAAPATADCSLLRRMAEMPQQLGRLATVAPAGGSAIVERDYDAALGRLPPERVESALQSKPLAPFVDPLNEFVAALAEARRLSRKGDGAAVAEIAESDAVWIAADLVQRLLADLNCPPPERKPPPLELDVKSTLDLPPPPGEGRGRGGGSGEEAERRVRPRYIVYGTAGVATFAAALAAGPVLRLLFKRRWRNRKRRRFTCRYKTTIHYKSTTYNGLIIDVSRVGAQISAHPKLRKGEEVGVTICDRIVPANVQWRGPYFAGVRFDQELDHDQFTAVLPPETAEAVLSLNATVSEFDAS